MELNVKTRELMHDLIGRGPNSDTLFALKRCFETAFLNSDCKDLIAARGMVYTEYISQNKYGLDFKTLMLWEDNLLFGNGENILKNDIDEDDMNSMDCEAERLISVL